MAFDNPENPTIMEDFIRALGAEPCERSLHTGNDTGGYILKEKIATQNMCERRSWTVQKGF